MKQVFIIAFCLLFSFSRAQPCDTIRLNNGAKFYGVVTNINKTRFTITNCDSTGVSRITFLKKDVNIQAYNTPSYKKENESHIDTLSCFHIGVIPYQILSRSSGLYVGYDFKHVSLEYRPTYTYATNLAPIGISIPIMYENFYFQGINNSLLFNVPFKGKVKVGLIVSYKHWWHGKQSIYNEQSSMSGSDDELHLKETKSTVMNGFTTGLEFTLYKKTSEHFDFSFFWNGTLTFFKVHSYVYSLDYIDTMFGGSNYYLTKIYPYYETTNRIYFNITAGLKIGYRKPIK